MDSPHPCLLSLLLLADGRCCDRPHQVEGAKRAAFDPFGADVPSSQYIDVSSFSDEHLMVQYLALRVWRAPLGRADHDFLHSCSIFSNLKAVMGAGGTGDDGAGQGGWWWWGGGELHGTRGRLTVAGPLLPLSARVAEEC